MVTQEIVEALLHTRQNLCCRLQNCEIILAIRSGRICKSCSLCCLTVEGLGLRDCELGSIGSTGYRLSQIPGPGKHRTSNKKLNSQMTFEKSRREGTNVQVWIVGNVVTVQYTCKENNCKLPKSPEPNSIPLAKATINEGACSNSLQN